MKKDIFNGNVKEQYINYVKFSIALAAILFFVFFVFFLLFALLYEKIEYAARMMMFIFSGICFFVSLLYPALSIYAIRNYSKRSKLAKLMINNDIKEDMTLYVDVESDELVIKTEE